MAVGFQPAFGGALNGSINAVALVSPGATPSNIIESGLPFTIRVTFRMSGIFVHMVNGTYRVHVSLEGYGAAATEVDLPVQNRSAATPNPLGPGFREYTVDVPAPGNLPNGAYKVSVLVTHVTDIGQPGPIAGFSDDTTIQIFPNSPITNP